MKRSKRKESMARCSELSAWLKVPLADYYNDKAAVLNLIDAFLVQNPGSELTLTRKRDKEEFGSTVFGHEDLYCPLVCSPSLLGSVVDSIYKTMRDKK